MCICVNGASVKYTVPIQFKMKLKLLDNIIHSIQSTWVGQNNGNTRKFQIYFYMVFWLQPSREIWPFEAPFLRFLIGNWVFKKIINLCCNFRSCILVILPTNPRKSLTLPIRQLSNSSRVLLQWGGFSFFLKCCHYFQDSTPRNTK